MQSRRRSLAETCTGTVLGLILNWFIVLWCLKTFHDPYWQTSVSTLLCTLNSLVRGYGNRRFYNWLDHRANGKIAA